MTTEQVGATFDDWNNRIETAEAMIPMVGKLYRDHGIVTLVYGKRLINKSTIDIIKAHRFVRQTIERELSTEETFPFIQAMNKLDLAPARVDVGKLAIKYQEQGNGKSIDEFVATELSAINTGKQSALDKPQDVVLYGFGRIGRLLARILIEKAGGGDKLRLRAIVIRKGGKDDLQKRASLLRRDSVHGQFNGTISVDEENNLLIANGVVIKIIYANNPEEVDYTLYGINDAIVVDNTGKWRDRDGLGLHLARPGVQKVLLTAPGKGDLPNIVFGVNENNLTENDNIISAASCTTNAITPVIRSIMNNWEIKQGHVETCHSFTNDQNLIDNYHSAERRGRSAPLNMVITETGAAKAVSKAIPEMEGKLTGNAIRVPTPNVSLAILNLTLDRAVEKNEINEYLRDAALNSNLQDQIDYVNSCEVVSSDFVGSRYAGVVDALATITKGDQAVLYVWYDNEFGYSCQVIRLLQHVAGLDLPSLPQG